MLPSDFFRRNVVLSFQEDAIGIRMMGPNAHHIGPSMLAAEIGPMAVTFDIAILLAQTREKMP